MILFGVCFLLCYCKLSASIGFSSSKNISDLRETISNHVFYNCAVNYEPGLVQFMAQVRRAWPINHVKKTRIRNSPYESRKLVQKVYLGVVSCYSVLKGFKYNLGS